MHLLAIFTLYVCCFTAKPGSSMGIQTGSREHRPTDTSKLLSPAQTEDLMQLVISAGAPTDANMLSLQTTNGRGFTIKTNAGSKLKTWTSPDATAGDSMIRMLLMQGVDLTSTMDSMPMQNPFADNDVALARNPKQQNTIIISATTNPVAGSALDANLAEDVQKQQLHNANVVAPSMARLESVKQLSTPDMPNVKVNTVNNGKASAASNGNGNLAVDGSNAFAQSDGRGAAVSNAAGSAFISGQGTVAASGSTEGGLVVAIICQNGAQQVNQRNFNVLVGGTNGLTYSPDQLAADPGDTISFIFGTKNHTVTQSTFENPCNYAPGDANSGFMPSQNDLSSADTSSSPVLQFEVNSTLPQFFYCAQSTHCQQGMVFALNPTTQQSIQSYSAAAESGTSSSQNISSSTLDTSDYGTDDIAAQLPTSNSSSIDGSLSSMVSENSTLDNEQTDLTGSPISPALLQPLNTDSAGQPGLSSTSVATNARTESATSTTDSVTPDVSSDDTDQADSADVSDESDPALASSQDTQSDSLTAATAVPTNDPSIDPEFGMEIIKTENVNGQDLNCFAETDLLAKGNAGGCFGMVDKANAMTLALLPDQVNASLLAPTSTTGQVISIDNPSAQNQEAPAALGTNVDPALTITAQSAQAAASV